MDGNTPIWAFMMIAVMGSAVLMLFGLPFYAIWTYHKRKLEEIKARNRLSISEETRVAIEALRQEFNGLRDTTTQYDMSFDTALHRLESRIGTMERRISSVEQEPTVAQIQR